MGENILRVTGEAEGQGPETVDKEEGRAPVPWGTPMSSDNLMQGKGQSERQRVMGKSKAPYHTINKAAAITRQRHLQRGLKGTNCRDKTLLTVLLIRKHCQKD